MSTDVAHSHMNTRLFLSSFIHFNESNHFVYWKLVRYVKEMRQHVIGVNTFIRARKEFNMVRGLIIMIIILIVVVLLLFTKPLKVSLKKIARSRSNILVNNELLIKVSQKFYLPIEFVRLMFTWKCFRDQNVKKSLRNVTRFFSEVIIKN